VQASERVADGAAPIDLAPTGLEATGITKSWPGQGRVLSAVDLTLPAGSVTWIGGRNGVGKTTLLRILVGLIAPDRGEIRLGGLDPVRQRREYQRRLGFVSAGYGGLYARLTVGFHLRMWSRLALLPKDTRQSAFARSVSRFELEDLVDARVDRLSMGQRQRVRLALGLLHEPDLVVLDEPRNSLDAEAVALLVAALNDLRARGGAAVYCSPTGEDLGARPDHSLRLEQGRLVSA
jgi:ABC-2 type transport system ATP-binding protein